MKTSCLLFIGLIASFSPTRILAQPALPPDIAAYDAKLTKLIDAQDFTGLEKLHAEGLEKPEYFSLGIDQSEYSLRTAFGCFTYPNRCVPFAEKWAKAKPDSATPLIGWANILFREAWRIRGGTYADSVSDENMKAYATKMKQAWDLLQKAEQLKNVDPMLYALKIKLAHQSELPRAEIERIVDTATTKFPENIGIPVAHMVHLHPKWGGSGVPPEI